MFFLMGEIVKFSDLFQADGDGSYIPMHNIAYKKWPFRNRVFLQSGLRLKRGESLIL